MDDYSNDKLNLVNGEGSDFGIFRISLLRATAEAGLTRNTLSPSNSGLQLAVGVLSAGIQAWICVWDSSYSLNELQVAYMIRPLLHDCEHHVRH